MYFPREEYERRWGLVYDELERRGYEAAVVWSCSGGTYDRCANVLYLTNYYSTSNGQIVDEPIWAGRALSGVILANRETPELHMDEPFPRFAELATDRAHYHNDVVRGVYEAVNARKITGRVAFVGSDILSWKYGKRMQENTSEIEWSAEDDLLGPARRIKSSLELDCYREAGRIATRGLTRLMEGLVAGRTEAEAAGAAAEEVIRSGGKFHMIPVNHGDTLEYWTRAPLTQASTDRPSDGDLVRGFVFGPIYQGYWLDPGRTAVCGAKPTAAQRELIETTVGIIEQCIAAIRPGVRVAEVAELGDRLMDKAGTVKDQIAELVPLYGHGVGLFWEHPYIGKPFMTDETETFDAGMVLGIEAFVGREGVGSTAMEQNVIVGDSGTELLTTAPMIWY